eukprot:gene11944-12087_t
MAQHVTNGHEQFLRWHEKLGGIVRIRLLHRDIVLIADPQVAAEVLAKGPNECARRAPEYTTFDVAHGQAGFSAILTEQDEERWKAIRRGIAPAYALNTVRDTFPAIVSCYAEICRRIASGASTHTPKISSKSSSKKTDVSSSNNLVVAEIVTKPEVWVDEEIFAATIHVLLQAFLKMPAKDVDFDVLRTAAAGGELVAITNTFVSQPWKKWLYMAFPNMCQESVRFHSCRQHMMSVTKCIAQHIEAQRPAAATDMSLAACLSRLTEPSTGKPFSTAALQAELFLEIVGQESVPWTVAWSLYLLSQHPEVEASLLEELSAAGLPCNGHLAAVQAALNMDMIKQLPVCTAVLHEAMRLFPAGVAAAPSILMYSGNWDNPHQFSPDRWLKDTNYATDPATGAMRFVPFGVGPKACVAQHLAMVQCKVLLALLLSCYSWQLAPRMGGPKGVESSTVAALELRVDQGMWLCPTPRTATS